VGDAGHVIFSDISRPLLDRAQTLARELGVVERCSFVEASAGDLHGIADASVDAVTTRSVLIYVRDKAAALRACYRVLRDGGRAVLWEPINRFEATYGDVPAFGVTDPAVAPLAERLRDYYRSLQPLDSDPMMDFDERDLLRHAEAAGFTRVTIDVHIELAPAPPMKWDVVMNSSGNPNIPTTGEAMAQVLSAGERALFEEHVRPLVEAGGRLHRSASCLLVATKHGGGGHA
jgi:SAM-dependent methyltransferase